MMKKFYATTAFALAVFAGSTSAFAQTLTDADEVTCAEFLAMEQIEQETMLSEIIARSDGGSLAETDLGVVAIVCTGNDDLPVTEALDR